MYQIIIYILEKRRANNHDTTSIKSLRMMERVNREKLIKILRAMLTKLLIRNHQSLENIREFKTLILKMKKLPNKRLFSGIMLRTKKALPKIRKLKKTLIVITATLMTNNYFKRIQKKYTTLQTKMKIKKILLASYINTRNRRG